MSLTYEALRSYQERWRAVKERQLLEQPYVTVAERWRKLNALLRMAKALGLQPAHSETEIEAVRARWNRLRTVYAVDTGKVISP